MTIATVPTTIDTQPLLLDMSDTTLIVTPEQFDVLCAKNPDLRLELTPNRELVVMAPAGRNLQTRTRSRDFRSPNVDRL